MTNPTTTGPVLRIGALAERSGTTPPTIRYYEAIGLLPRADRQRGGQRRYGPEDVRRLSFIRHCREFGFSIEQVRALVDLLENPQRDCREARDIAQARLDALRAKLRELRALEGMITDFVHRCDSSCAGGPGPECVPLADLTRVASRAGDARAARTRSRRRVVQPR